MESSQQAADIELILKHTLVAYLHGQSNTNYHTVWSSLQAALTAALEVHKRNTRLKLDWHAMEIPPELDNALTELDTAMAALKESVS